MRAHINRAIARLEATRADLDGKREALEFAIAELKAASTDGKKLIKRPRPVAAATKETA